MWCERNQFATVSIDFYFIAIVCIANNNKLAGIGMPLFIIYTLCNS